MKKIKTLIQENKFAVMASVSAIAMSIPTIAHAEVPDVTTSMTTAMQSIVTQTLNSISAIAPIGITIFGAMFAWKKGVQFFKGVTK